MPAATGGTSLSVASLRCPAPAISATLAVGNILKHYPMFKAVPVSDARDLRLINSILTWIRVSYHCPPLPSQGLNSIKFPLEGPVVYCDIPVCLMEKHFNQHHSPHAWGIVFHRGNSFHIKFQAEHMLHLWTRGTRGRFSQLCAEPDTARVLVIWPWNPVQLRRGACFFPFYSPPHRFF